MSITTGEQITIVAILAGPIFAVVTQLIWQRLKEKRDQKRWILSTLMSLRAMPLHNDYVKALNMIDMVYYRNNAVRTRWKKLLEHFGSASFKQNTVPQATLEKAKDLAAELMAEIAKDLGYEYDHTHIKENAYYPKLQSEIQEKGVQLLLRAAEVFEGKASIKVKVE